MGKADFGKHFGLQDDHGKGKGSGMQHELDKVKGMLDRLLERMRRRDDDEEKVLFQKGGVGGAESSSSSDVRRS